MLNEATTTAGQADVAAAGRGMLDAVLRAWATQGPKDLVKAPFGK